MKETPNGGFLEKCIRCSDCVALVLNKTILSTDEFVECLRDFSLNPKSDTEVMKAFRKWLRNRKKHL